MTTFSSYLEKLSMLFMTVGRSAPRFERMALLYPKSRDLQSSLSEYFIVVVQMCHDVVNFTRKSKLQKISASVYDSNFTKYQADLESWGRAIKDEVDFLVSKKIHEEAEANSHLRDVAARLFKTSSHQQKLLARQRVLEFCSDYDPTTVWKQIRKAGNTIFFRQSAEYQNWKERAISGTLIYTGKLGSGKSVLLANIVDDLHMHDPGDKVLVSFFFCRYDMPETLKAQNIIGSISRQILSQVADIAKSAIFLEGSEGLERSKRLVGILQSAIPSASRVFAVIDGIDELDETEREKLLQKLLELQDTFALLICISHRQDANNPMKVDPEQLSSVRAASMPENTAEIESYIENELEKRVRSNKLIVGDLALLLEIKEALVKGSQGMFLWVALQIEEVCAMQTDNAIREALGYLPTGLSETFRRILQSANAANSYQRPILELIIVAQRPLSLEELREAMSVTPGNASWNPSGMLNDIHSTLACCGSLVVIDEEQLTLSFVHHSVKQYLLGDFEDPASRPITDIDGHRRMSDIIVTYLNYSAFDRQISTNVLPEMRTIDTFNGIIRSTQNSADSITSLALKLLCMNGNSDFNMAKALAEAQRNRPRSTNQFHFRQYALLHWGSHIVRSLPLRNEIVLLFQKLWEKKTLTTTPTLLAEDPTALLAFGVGLGLAPFVESILEMSLDVNRALYPHRRTALHMAVLCGSTDISVLLLHKKGKQIDLTVKDDFGQTPIEIAHEKEMFSLLNVFLVIEEMMKGNYVGPFRKFEAAQILLASATQIWTKAYPNGMLVREVAAVRCELEGSPAKSFGMYRGGPFRTIPSLQPIELEGDTQWPKSPSICSSRVCELEEDDHLAGPPNIHRSDSWKIKLVEAQYVALSTQGNAELINEDSEIETWRKGT